MRWSSLALALLTGVALGADGTTTTATDPSTSSSTSSSLALSDASTVSNPSSVAMPSGSYLVYSTTVTLSNGDSSVLVSSTITGNSSATSTGNQTVVTTTSDSLTVLIGGAGTTTLGNSSMNATATTTGTATATPVVNTRPCNNYAEFCQRKYSNITMVAAHNSPFVRKGNAAANQDLTVTNQLNDGIRMLQFQVHDQNGTMYLCHSSCEILNVGKLETYLTQVAQWVRENQYDVVTILMGNADYVAPGNFTDPVEKSGLMPYIYTPSKIPMGLNDWPTLSEMILSNKRVVFFMDYQANQTAIPWLMDEFSQIWETPFSPTDRDFPCTEQRPPGLSTQDAKSRMYMANHNLNLELSLGSISLLIPNTAEIQTTNAVSGYGSLGRMAKNCTDTWNRPPNFLLVDYYNYGNFNGSVFEVAAEMNNVTYNRTCCGKSSAAVHGMTVTSVSTLLLFIAGVQFFMSVF